MEKHTLAKGIPKELPENPGVYIFHKGAYPLYIGKARNLKARLTSYFGQGIIGKTKEMLLAATHVSFIKVDSEFEAILLEAKLVRQHLPKYNSQLKDDKSPLYIGITQEEYPRVLTLRKTQIKNFKLKALFGPYAQASAARQVLKILKKAFPFSTHKPGKRGCLDSQIGLCNPCPSLIKTLAEKKAYFANIRNVKATLRGDLKKVRRELGESMQRAARNENYETAKILQEKIAMIDYISQPEIKVGPYLANPNLLSDIREKEIRNLRKLLQPFFDLKSLKRIECFDAAHLAGTHPTASMVTFINAEPAKDFYRHFKISFKGDDLALLKNVFERRKKHFADWGKPDLIVVDGGKGQVATAIQVFKEEISVIGLAKRFETIYFKKGNSFQNLKPQGPALNLLQRMRDEAHRFARRLHHKQVLNAILKS